MAALEQEIASVIRFILDSVPGITPYYWDIPEGFVVPSVFFPQPELTPLGDTFASYAVEYDWYIRFFASTDEDAYASAAAALNALCAARLLVPLIDKTGAAAGGGVRLKDPGGVKRLDTGTAQLTLHWDSRRPYNRVDCQKVMHYNLDLKAAEGKLNRRYLHGRKERERGTDRAEVPY